MCSNVCIELVISDQQVRATLGAGAISIVHDTVHIAETGTGATVSPCTAGDMGKTGIGQGAISREKDKTGCLNQRMLYN